MKNCAYGFNSKLISLRKDKPIKDVAGAVGISVAALEAYEAGRRIPRDDVKQRLSALYRCPLSELFPRDLTVGEAIEVREIVAKLEAEQVSDFSDVVRALAADDVDTAAVMADVYRLANLRCIAKRNGVQIQKKFNRTFGESGYMLVDTVGNFVIAGADPVPYSLTLDDVEGWVSVMREKEQEN